MSQFPGQNDDEEIEEIMDKMGRTKRPKGFETVRAKRAKTERNMRNMQRKVREEKRKKTLVRASQPRTKHNRHKPRKQKTFRALQRSVEEEHEKMDHANEVYMENYHNFLTFRANALQEATAKDEQWREKVANEKKAAEVHRDRARHHRALLPSLREISGDPCMTLRREPGPKMSTLDSFVQMKNGKHFSQTKCRWDNFYHDVVKVWESRVTEWPHESEEQKEKRRQDMKDSGKCENCDVPLIPNHKEASMLCPECGAICIPSGVNFQVTFDQQQSSSRGPAPYDRLAHVSYTFASRN